jgi:hypothetical protein
VTTSTADNADVRCRDRSGGFADTMFVVRFLDPLDVGRRIEVVLRGFPDSDDDCGEMEMRALRRAWSAQRRRPAGQQRRREGSSRPQLG